MENYAANWMTEELNILRDSATRFFEKEFTPHEEDWIKNGCIDRDAWTKAGEAGLLCASIPEEYGGAGGNITHEAVLLEAQVQAGVASFGNSVHSGMIAHYFNTYGSEEQKQRWLPKMATGECVASICMTEPGTGSDLQGIKTTIKPDGDSYVINGSKTFITNGHWANIIVVVGTSDPSLGAKGLSLVIVETDQVESGFTRGRLLGKIGQKGQDTTELFFDDVRVPKENLLGGVEGQGFYQLMAQLRQERLIIGILATAWAEKAVSLTSDYVKTREAFGQKLIELQNTRIKLAECKTEAFIARVFVDQCVQWQLEGTLDAATASMSKWWCSQKQNDIIDECLQLHGGYGYMSEFLIGRMYTDARVQMIYGGANEIQKELIARTL
jgi:acyl-CoA dehydrogenase